MIDKKAWFVVSLLAVALLAGSVYMGMRLVRFGRASLFPSGSSSQLGPHNHIIIDPAPEVPRRPADLVGQVTDRQGNSVFVMNNNKIARDVTTPQEVVMVKETLIYRDSTLDSHPHPNDGDHLQQTVESIPITYISQVNVVEVWGQRRGSRWIADLVIVYDP